MNARTATNSSPVTPEIQQLVADFKANHNEAVMSVACLLELNTSLLRAFGRQQGTSVQSMLDLQQAMALNWLSARGLGPLDLDEARKEIRRAGQTAHYLDKLFD